MRTFAIAAAVILLIVALQPVLVWVRVLGFRLRPSAAARRADPDTLPPELAPIFAEAARELGGLGFVFSFAQWNDSISADEAHRPAHVFVHPLTQAMAVVTPPVFGNGRRLYTVTFETGHRSGHVLTTVDALLHLTPIVPPGRDWRDHYLSDVPKQWAAHEAAVLERAPADPAMALTPDEYVRMQTEGMAGCIEEGLARGALRPAEPGTCRPTPRFAWRFATRLREGARRVALMERQAARAHEPADAWLAAEIYAFNAIDTRPAAGRSRRSKATLFLASALVSGLAIGLIFSWRLVPILIAVLLIHELGHLAGMRMFGFRDRQILFLPLLGAAAVGRKDDATAAQRLVVLLLGPVPGIALGFGAVYLGNVTGFSWLNEFGFTSLILNYLNLLPITPLDGGRVVELLFLQRAPRAGAAFLLASAVVAGLAGLAFGDFVLVGLSLFLLAATPARWRTATTVRATLERVPAEASRADRVRAAFATLDERVGRLSSGARLQLARSVVEHLDARPAARTLALGGGALYALLLAAPIGGALRFLVPRPEFNDICTLVDQDHAESTPGYGDALADVCDDRRFTRASGEQQWTTLMERARVRLEIADTAGATAYLRLAATAAVFHFPFDDARLEQTRRLLGDLETPRDP